MTSSIIFTAHRILNTKILNTKKVGFVKAGFTSFANSCLLPLQKKTGLINSPEKRASTSVKQLLPVCQVREIYLSFRSPSQRARDRKTIGSHLKPYHQHFYVAAFIYVTTHMAPDCQ